MISVVNRGISARIMRATDGESPQGEDLEHRAINRNHDPFVSCEAEIRLHQAGVSRPRSDRTVRFRFRASGSKMEHARETMPSETEMPRAIGQLTSLRFFAALAVLLSHLAFLADNQNPAVKWVYDNLFFEGYSGVSFFYVLSGFIISHAYGDRIRHRHISAGAYFAYRMVRILPLHWLVALPFLAWLLLIKNEAPGITTILLNLSLLHAFAPQSAIHYSLNAPSWSLSCELFFYLMFPLLVMLRTRTLATLAAGGIALIATAAAYWVLKGNQPSAMAEWFFYLNPPTRLVDFAAGMLIYRAARAEMYRDQSGTALEIGLVLLIPLLMVVCHQMDVPMPFRWQLAYLPAMAALVLVFAHGRGAVSRILKAPLPILLGEASFALYLTHRPVITLAKQISDGYLSSQWDVVLAAALLVGCVLLSLLVFHFIDKPVQRRLRLMVARFEQRTRPRGRIRDQTRTLAQARTRALAMSAPALVTIATVAFATTQQSAPLSASIATVGPAPATRVGVNLFGPETYNRQQVFTNLIAQSEWFTAEGDGWTRMDDRQLDALGWVKYLKPGQAAPRPLILPPSPFRRIAVRCVFLGEGELSTGGIVEETDRGSQFLDFDLVSQGGADEGAWIQLDRTNPANPLRNIDCREKGRPAAEMFHPEFVKFLQGFAVIRFLDWQMINGNRGGVWAKRTPAAYSSQIAKEGVAIENMIRLANEARVDPWFLIPYNADDEYIRNFARMVHDRIAPERTVYVELGNEVWNDMFEAAEQAREEGLKLRLDPAGDPTRAQMRRYAQKSRNVLQIWTSIFADRPEKLVRVVSSLNVYPDLAKMILEYEDTARWVDALATAPYIHLDLADRGQRDVDWVYSRLNAAIDETIDYAVQNKAIAASFGKRFITYEGGQHLVTTDMPLAYAVQRDPRMAAVYERYLAAWKAKLGDLLMLYASTAPIGEYGSWGLREYAGQPLAQAPKERVVRRFLEDLDH